MESNTPDALTVQRLVGGLFGVAAGEAGHSITKVTSGLSGMPVYRCRIETTPQRSCVIKKAYHRERLVFAMLTDQKQPGVPAAFSLDLTSPEADWVCLEDCGDVTRPSSLDPITDHELRSEAEALAKIHFANRALAQSGKIDWLPRLDLAWVQEVVLGHFFWPAWEQARGDVSGLGALLEPFAAAVEELAAHLPQAVTPLFEDFEALTLVHCDINPSNVLIRPDGRGPGIIDWQTAHRGPLYVDVPHHFCTRAQAEHYRLALAALGFEISSKVFDEHFRVAARLIGFRYIWWTLAEWQGSEADTAWVMHYLSLILNGEASDRSI